MREKKLPRGLTVYRWALFFIAALCPPVVLLRRLSLVRLYRSRLVDPCSIQLEPLPPAIDPQQLPFEGVERAALFLESAGWVETSQGFFPLKIYVTEHPDYFFKTYGETSGSPSSLEGVVLPSKMVGPEDHWASVWVPRSMAPELKVQAGEAIGGAAYQVLALPIQANLPIQSSSHRGCALVPPSAWKKWTSQTMPLSEGLAVSFKDKKSLEKAKKAFLDRFPQFQKSWKDSEAREGTLLQSFQSQSSPVIRCLWLLVGLAYLLWFQGVLWNFMYHRGRWAKRNLLGHSNREQWLAFMRQEAAHGVTAFLGGSLFSGLFILGLPLYGNGLNACPLFSYAEIYQQMGWACLLPQSLGTAGAFMVIALGSWEWRNFPGKAAFWT